MQICLHFCEKFRTRFCQKIGCTIKLVMSTGNMHTKQLNLGAFFPPTLYFYQTQCADIYRRCNINGQIVALHHRPLSRTCFPIWVVKSRHWPTFWGWGIWKSCWSTKAQLGTPIRHPKLDEEPTCSKIIRLERSMTVLDRGHLESRPRFSKLPAPAKMHTVGASHGTWPKTGCWGWHGSPAARRFQT